VADVAVQAHRGSPDTALGVRENTLESFFRARQLGADGVELDVRMTADGAVVVHHDPVIAGLGPICELTAGELPDVVPLLPPVLDACLGLTVNIEIKNLPGEPGFDPEDSLVAEVIGLVEATGRASDVVISSFWPDSLVAARAAGPEIPTGLLLAGWFDPAEAVRAAVSRGCTSLHPHVDLVSAGLVDEAHDAGLSVAVWTVNDRAVLQTMVEIGVDTVITDDVALALAVLDPV
jgi:glycerophosphoryl diester phosphodiesterase